MPDATPTPETPAPVAPAPDNSEVERQARLLSDARAAYMEGRAAVAEDMLRQAASRPTVPDNRPDPLDKVASGDITISADERKTAFDQAINERVAASRQQQNDEFERRLAVERQVMESNMAISAITASRPDLNDPKNAPNMKAAMTKAAAEAEMRGERLNPVQMMQRAVSVYDTVFAPKGAPAVPYVEGGARPDLTPGMQSPAAPQGPSQLEELYGMKAGQIGQAPTGPTGWADEAVAYVKNRTSKMIEKGVNSSLDDVRRNFMS